MHLLFKKEKEKEKKERKKIEIENLISIRGQSLYSRAKTRGIALNCS